MAPVCTRHSCRTQSAPEPPSPEWLGGFFPFGRNIVDPSFQNGTFPVGANSHPSFVRVAGDPTGAGKIGKRSATTQGQLARRGYRGQSARRLLDTASEWRRRANLSQWRQAQCSEPRIFRSDRVSAGPGVPYSDSRQSGFCVVVNHIEWTGKTRPRCAASEYVYYSLVESRSMELP